MGLSRTVSDINGDFNRKTRNFPTLHVLRALLKEPFSYTLGIGHRRSESKI